jgi:hypothetical protein
LFYLAGVARLELANHRFWRPSEDQMLLIDIK